jgi:Doubled CXXCH motif (Paired_CXXCH_1)
MNGFYDASHAILATMTRIDDDYELPDMYDDIAQGDGLYRRRAPSLLPWVAGALLIGLAVAGVFAYQEVLVRQRDDANCLSCHTGPSSYTTYTTRATDAVAGAPAVDLSSHHYQQIRGNGGDIRCIDCHRGDDSDRHRFETVALSAQLSFEWMLGRQHTGPEVSAQVITATNGITTMLGSAALRAPALTNHSCMNCHRDQMLTAGLQNHMHNTLPAVYVLWKNGARLLPSEDDPDPQAVIARGLVNYPTRVTCADCHQTHRATEDPGFVNEAMVQRQCAQCHSDAGITIRP